VSHAAAAADCLAWAEEHGLAAGDRVLQMQSAGFDAAVEQIFATLLAGAAVVLRGPEMWGPRELAAAVATWRLSVLDLPTAFFARWVEEAAELPSSPPPPSSLRLIVVSGEELGGEAVRRWRQSPLAAVPLVNCYGPTEAVVSATVHRLARKETPAVAEITAGAATTDIAARPVPLGRPLPGRVPDLASVPRQGCVFRPRCPLATDVCATVEPADTVVGDRRFACHVTAGEAA